MACAGFCMLHEQASDREETERGLSQSAAKNQCTTAIQKYFRGYMRLEKKQEERSVLVLVFGAEFSCCL